MTAQCQCTCGHYRCGGNDGGSRVGLFLERGTNYCFYCHDKCGLKAREQDTWREYQKQVAQGKWRGLKEFATRSKLFE